MYYSQQLLTSNQKKHLSQWLKCRILSYWPCCWWSFIKIVYQEPCQDFAYPAVQPIKQSHLPLDLEYQRQCLFFHCHLPVVSVPCVFDLLLSHTHPSPLLYWLTIFWWNQDTGGWPPSRWIPVSWSTNMRKKIPFILSILQ